MILLDSNIIIYLTKADNDKLQQFVSSQSVAASIISNVEVLGFHRLGEADRTVFEQFFEVCKILPLTNEVAKNAVRLRQDQKIGLGDSIIAGTALSYGLPLLTRNERDFQWIRSIEIIDTAHLF